MGVTVGVFVPAPIFIPPVIVKCSDKFITLSKLSGDVTLTLHCPGDIIEPSLWNNRYTCLEYQLCYINLLIQEITNQNPNLGATLSNQYASVTDKLTALPPVTPGQPVSHEYFNVIYDHVNLAYNTLTYFLNNVLSLTSTQQAQVTPYLNQLVYVINTITKKYAMDLVRASDWNALTNALYAIDQILQFIKQNWYIQAIQGTVLTTQPIQLISTTMTTSAGAKQT